MFGTFNLFNFLQQPITGKIPATYVPGDIVDGSGRAGTVTDANWEFPYGDTAVPSQIVQGHGGVFEIRLFSDSDVGLRLASVENVVSGKFDGQIDRASAFLGFSGGFFPKDADSETNYMLFSGLVTGSRPDSQFNEIYISGQILAAQPDFSYPFLVISGKVDNCEPGRPYFREVISGYIESGNKEPHSINVHFSGAFIPVMGDQASISYGMVSFSGLYNTIVADVSFEDDVGNIKYGFSSYSSVVS